MIETLSRTILLGPVRTKIQRNSKSEFLNLKSRNRDIFLEIKSLNSLKISAINILFQNLKNQVEAIEIRDCKLKKEEYGCQAKVLGDNIVCGAGHLQ